MNEMKRIRLHDGTIRWSLLPDSADPERYLELFVTESCGEHVRQHERITAKDGKAETAGDNTYAYRRFGSRIGIPVLFLQHFTGKLDNCYPAVTDGTLMTMAPFFEEERRLLAFSELLIQR
jgi:hypothetical protein